MLIYSYFLILNKLREELHWLPIGESFVKSFKNIKLEHKLGNKYYQPIQFWNGKTGYYLKSLTVYYLNKKLYVSYSSPFYIESEG